MDNLNDMLNNLNADLNRQMEELNRQMDSFASVGQSPVGESVNTETQVSRTCPQCGHVVAEEASFCPECGYNFSANENDVPTDTANDEPLMAEQEYRGSDEENNRICDELHEKYGRKYGTLFFPDAFTEAQRLTQKDLDQAENGEMCWEICMLVSDIISWMCNEWENPMVSSLCGFLDYRENNGTYLIGWDFEGSDRILTEESELFFVKNGFVCGRVRVADVVQSEAYINEFGEYEFEDNNDNEDY